MGAVVGADYWDELYRKQKLTGKGALFFQEVFAEYLPRGGAYFEAGCYPGTFLTYLCRTYDYEANGIDTTPFVLTRLPEFLKAEGIRIGELIRGDFLQYPFRRKYDVVCSFGFLEHFVDFQQVIQRHIDLLKPRGVLVLTCPNFRGIQHLLRAVLDMEDLRRHVLPSMDFKAWNPVLEASGMRVLYQSYYRTFGFWTSYLAEDSARAWTARLMAIAADRMSKHIDIPNPLTSPLMISVSKKEM